jgi:hypothetical protein
LQCETPAQVLNTSTNEYPGGRGINLIVDNILTSVNNLLSAQPSPSAQISYLNKASYYDESVASAKTVWMKGFFYPEKSSNYLFTLVSNSSAILFLSEDETAAKKIQIASTYTVKMASKYLTGRKL